MKVVLNSIAVEPNRWTEGKVPHRPLVELIPAIARSGSTINSRYSGQILLSTRPQHSDTITPGINSGSSTSRIH